MVNNHEEEAPPFDISFINKGQEDQMDVYGYRRHTVFTAISWFFTVLTLGAVRLVFHWWPRLMLYATHCRCPLRIAEKLFIIEHPKKSVADYHVETINTVTSTNLHIEIGEIEHIGETINSGDNLNRITEKRGKTPTVSIGDRVFADLSSIRMFELKKQRYIWDDEAGSFLKLNGLESNVSTAYLHQQAGLSLSEQNIRQLLYGRNMIAVPMQGITELVFMEVLNPFYIFQLFSFGLWFAYEYVSYAVAILIMSAFSIIMTVIQTRDNQKKLHGTIDSRDVVSVVRIDSSEEARLCMIPSDQLVPGDVMVVPAHGCVMHCDAVLLTGSCIVNESILTGESVPVTKIPLPNSPSVPYDSKEHGKHTLFCGTRVIKTRNQSHKDMYAVVIQTGFSTVKGELVRSILYPTPITFKFEQDSYRFIQLMAGLASVGFLYTVITKLMRGVPATTIALEALDLVTIVVPPALPAAMTVGCMSAQARLRKNNIYCVSPRMINVSGCINCVCFDKTGTLTEDELDVWGVVSLKENGFDAPVNNVNTLEPSHLLYAMAACHSLSVIDANICGDPLDIKMFEWTGWIIEESDMHSNHIIVCPSTNTIKKDCQEIEIVYQLPFSSSLQRMTVVTRHKEEGKERGKRSYCTVYCKGSPEVIQHLCNPLSIPKDFDRKLEEFTEKGYRVLGIAYKNEDSDVSQLPREVIEKDLNFLGLVVFENRLKPLTAGVISALRSANIRTIMVTGDNQLTALSVARECGMVSPTQEVFIVDVTPPGDVKPAQLSYKPCRNKMSHETQTTFDDETKHKHVTRNQDDKPQYEMSQGNPSIGHCDVTPTPDASFVLMGGTWDLVHTHFPDEVAAVVSRCAVFSRMSPDQKQQLVLYLQSLGYYVGMCGDGANDCGALKAAHAGISLSEAESSVASPFTSRESTVDCVIKVIQEGRAALVTSFAIFKYMAGYSLTQFVSVMILYSIDSNLTDMQYLFVDLFIISVFAFLLGRTGANSGPLVSRPPEISLMSPAPIASLIGQVAIVVVFQFISFFSLSKYHWFEPFSSSKLTYKGPGCLENYAIFAVTSMQYVILAVVFCKGAPFRQPLSKNWSLWGTATVITLFIFYLILWPSQWFQDQFELVLPPGMDFRVFCVILCVANFILAGIYEVFICDNLISNKIRSTDINRFKKQKDD